jgi:hypothetical protein
MDLTEYFLTFGPTSPGPGPVPRATTTIAKAGMKFFVVSLTEIGAAQPQTTNPKNDRDDN